MCAINGITQTDDTRVSQMNLVTQHRGPDGSRVWSSEGVTLGHNRLAIIDLNERALQPMTTQSGRYTIVFNGEIYNFKELRAELEKAYTFTTSSDTEVLLRGYEVWGNALFEKLRGMFAFGIWDAEERSLILARDHMGIKPLYYALEDGVLIFSSELPGVLKGLKKKVLDERALSFYLTMEYVPAPMTLVRGVSKLEAGTMATFKNGTIQISSFFAPTFQKSAESNASIVQCIDRAVAREMISDRPIGAYLSGGFDSSIVTYHMTQHAPLVKTYSVDFEAVMGQEGDSDKFNADARLARRTAQHFGTDHKTLTISLQNVRSVLEDVCARASEPVANATAVTQFLLSDFVRKDGTVVALGGDGGDELFGGYTRHRIMMGAYLYQRLPETLQSLGGLLSPRIQKLSVPFFTPLHRALMVKDEKKIHPLLKNKFPINEETINFFDAYYARMIYPAHTHPLDVFMAVDRATWLADECFIRSDFASMAHGLELRVPFVDLDLVRLSEKVSIFQKVLPHQGKRIIRKAYRNILPDHLYREPKRGWLSPAAKWFRDPEINALAQSVFSNEYYDGLQNLFDWDSVRALLRDHVEKKTYALYPLWNIFVLQIWARENGIEYNAEK